ncbi:MAG: hypothetical protein M3324_03515 [Actinomycetota bacterium]|nr:hypothetical protein [Actinomycetota bacterium]
MTDRRDQEHERTEREKADKEHREKRERRADELREAWRRRHPSEPDDEKSLQRKEPPR